MKFNHVDMHTIFLMVLKFFFFYYIQSKTGFNELNMYLLSGDGKVVKKKLHANTNDQSMSFVGDN